MQFVPQLQFAQPVTSFLQGQQAAQQNQLGQQRQQANQLALMQAQQNQDNQNQLNTLVPQAYTTSDPTQRQQLLAQTAGLGPQGQTAASNISTMWANQTTLKQKQLATGADQAMRYAVAASQVQDPAQQAQMLEQGYNAMLQTGADPAHVQQLKAMSAQAQIRAMYNMAAPIKSLALASGMQPNLSKPVNVNVPGGTQQYVSQNGKLVPIGNFIGGGQQSQPSQSLPTTVTPALQAAVIGQESGGNASAVSPKGATGVMQVMPATASSIGYPNADLTNPAVNKQIGTQYLQQQLSKYGDARLALAAYNAGPGRVDGLIKQYGNNYDAIAAHLPQETQNYVPGVLKRMGIQPAGVVGESQAVASVPEQSVGDPQNIQQPAGVLPQNQGEAAPVQGAPASVPATPAPQPGTPPQPAQDASSMASAVGQKVQSMMAQNGPMTVPQLVNATGATPGMAQAVVSLSGIPANEPLDPTNPEQMQKLTAGMQAAASQSPHLLPASAQNVPRGTPQYGFKPTSQGSAPSGYQFKPDGTLQAIPGGPAANKANQSDVLAPPPADPTLQGQAYVTALPDNIRANAQLMAEGKAPWPTGFVLKTAYGQQLVAAATHINPAVDATSFPARLAVAKSVAAGPLGTSTNAFNTALEHANSLITLNQQMGISNLPAVSNLEAIGRSAAHDSTYKAYVAGTLPFASEMARAYKGGAPAEGEIDQYKATLDAGQGQRSIASTLQTYTKFLYSKALANARQYQQGMRQAGIPYAPLPPESQQAIDQSRAIALRAGVPREQLDAEGQNQPGINSVAASPAQATQQPSQQGWSIQQVH